MAKEIVSRAITNGDASNPLQANVVPITGSPGKYGLVVCKADGSPVGGVAWGQITGTLSNQTDLQTALDDLEANAIAYAVALGN